MYLCIPIWTCSFIIANLRQKKKEREKYISPCRRRKVTIHQDDCVVNNACDLFCVTYHDVIGAAPFSVCSVPLAAFFSLPPPILSFLILCLFLVGLCSWGKALFPSGWAVSLGKGWTGRSCWLQQVASCLGRGPWLPHLPGWQQ